MRESENVCEREKERKRLIYLLTKRNSSKHNILHAFQDWQDEVIHRSVSERLQQNGYRDQPAVLN